MVRQGIQPRLGEIVYGRAATTKSMPSKGGAESLGNIAPAISDDCGEIHMQIKQMASLQYMIINYCLQNNQKSENILRIGKIGL